MKTVRAGSMHMQVWLIYVKNVPNGPRNFFRISGL